MPIRRSASIRLASSLPRFFARFESIWVQSSRDRITATFRDHGRELRGGSRGARGVISLTIESESPSIAGQT
jgi:hypothetical protein